MELCELEQIDDQSARAFEIGETAIFIVRRDQDLFAYKNSCPHRGVRLEWEPDQFLDYEKQYIQCATHGALFKINDGECVAGPCAGKHLEPISCSLIDGKIHLDLNK